MNAHLLAGDWMEFGVAYGATINLAASWRSTYCGRCPHLHGFDTFTGEPLHCFSSCPTCMLAVVMIA